MKSWELPTAWRKTAIRVRWIVASNLLIRANIEQSSRFIFWCRYECLAAWMILRRKKTQSNEFRATFDELNVIWYLSSEWSLNRKLVLDACYFKGKDKKTHKNAINISRMPKEGLFRLSLTKIP